MYSGTRTGLEVVDLRGQIATSLRDACSGSIIQAVAGPRNRPDRVFVGLHDGCYRSLDAGEHWARVLEGDVRSVTVDPSDDAVVYAGTDPVHLFRSEDGGGHFDELTSLQQLPEQTHLRLGETELEDMSKSRESSFRHRRQEWWFPNPPHQGHPLHIFVHGDDPNLLMCAIEHGGIAQSNDRGATWTDVSGGIDYLDIHFVTSLPHRFDRFLTSSARGLFSSTDPAGGWTRAQRGCAHNYFHDIAFVPSADGTDPVVLVATADGSPGVWRRSGRGARAALYRSRDEGNSWERIGAGAGLEDDMDAMIWSLGVLPGVPHLVVAAIGESSSVPSPERPVGTGSVIVSEDAGEHWRPVVEHLTGVEHLHLAAA